MLLAVADGLLRYGGDAEVVQGLAVIAERAFASTLGCSAGQNAWRQMELILALELSARCEPSPSEAEVVRMFFANTYPDMDLSEAEAADAIELFRHAGGRPRKDARRWPNKWACVSALSERAGLGSIDEDDAKKLRQRLYQRFLGLLPHQHHKSS